MKSNETQNQQSSLPKKIFYVWNYLEWGGAQIYFFGLMKRMKKNCEVTALMPAGSGAQLINFLENIEIPYHFFDTHTDVKPAVNVKRKLQRHWNKIVSEFLLLRYLRKFDFTNSVIHVELVPWQSLTALLWLCRKAKVFVTLHNSILPIPPHRYLLWRIKFAILSRINNFHIFASNKNAKVSLQSLVPAKFYEKIKVTYTNVNPAEIDDALAAKINCEEMRAKFGLPTDKFLVFSVGQFIDRKGRWVFLDAAKKVLQNEKDIAFVWISNSKLSAEDACRIENYRLKENFILLDSAQIGSEHVELFKLLRVADAFALPSYVEGLPISLLEAMALGIPSISTNVYAIPEAVKPLETGCLIEAGDSDGLKEAIMLLKTDGALRRKLSVNGRKFVLESFSEPVVAEIAAADYAASFLEN